jgi:hypothetical protein
MSVPVATRAMVMSMVRGMMMPVGVSVAVCRHGQVRSNRAISATASMPASSLAATGMILNNRQPASR